LTDPLTLSAKGVGSGANTDNVKVSLDNKTGVFSESFDDPIAGQKVYIHRVAREAIQDGLGYFLSPGRVSGAVEISPAP
jgi:hypothetical protein